MKKNIFLLILFPVFAFSQQFQKSKAVLNQAIDNWHKAAAKANFEDYFQFLTDDAIFIGTDATENWTKAEFEKFAKPFFDKGKAWSFTSLERNIYFSADGKTAWFDELLNSQMKLCRGSGVLIRIKKSWKLQHYVLSMTIPNANTTEVVAIKSVIENSIIEKINK